MTGVQTCALPIFLARSRLGGLGGYSSFDRLRSIDLQPDNSATYMYRAAVERKLGKLKEAVEDYTRSIEKGTEGDNHLRAYIERGITKEQMKDFAGAAADYTTALQIDEKSPAALNGRGVVYDKLGKYEEAVADFS